MQNAINMRSINENVQIILRYDRSTNIIDNDVILIHIWNKLKLEFQRDIETLIANNITNNFVKRLQQIFELWSKKTRQINYQINQNKKKTIFQHELIKTRRDMLMQQ